MSASPVSSAPLPQFEQRTAFSPGHITGFFQICGHTNPYQKGSVGAGLVLNKGIHSTVTPFQGSGDTSVFLNGQKMTAEISAHGNPNTFETPDDSTNAVLTVASQISEIAENKYGSPFHFKIEENSVLPVGSGFGMSAAGALGTAFAANSALQLGLSKEKLTEIAHYAEVINGSGLGDVAGEASGGLAVREQPGGPAHGKYYSVPLLDSDYNRKVYCLVLGELSTKAVITDDYYIQKINRAGKSALSNFLKKPTLGSFMSESLTFTKSIGLLSPEAEKVIDSIDAADGSASQAMLGNTVFAIPSDREGADEYILNLMDKYGDVYECKIEKDGPYVCLPAF